MHFDEQAKNWDNDPKKIERAIIIANKIIDFIKPTKEMNAFEFGSGTGLLSYQLKDSFKTITLADNSEGMVAVLREKIAKQNITNFKPLFVDVLDEKAVFEKNNYDVVYTLMSMHHVLDTDKAAKIFNSMLKKDGYLCIADLDKEDGTFHTNVPGFVGHNGFDRVKFGAIFSNRGFEVVYDEICMEIEKEFDGKKKKFPLFLMICKKIA
ncbi:MAG: methyltransferase domain-containing protein [Lutibacter sp.]|jgi:ubiquinone/menaquinone biosynthesis C-methylase UbiE